MTREEDKGTTFDGDLHNMGGDIGPASIRGSNPGPGGKPRDDAEPKSGYAEPMGYVTGRDDEWGVTAGSGEKSVAARTDEIEDHLETAGPSPHPMPPGAVEQQGHDGHPEFRVEGPVDEATHGVVEDDVVKRPATARQPEQGHVTGDLDWSASDADDPDGGSGRTDADDGGYLPGEGTGRPYDT
ncbi:hypothetical protein [Nonomuraea sp. NPDC005501]|uniref:hypothetical protein n=1 Tax=unclassified Nonomuraea TaxID=2593643 RepID=UPI0033A9ADB4